MCSKGVLRMKSGIYRCPDDIKNFKISVKLKKLHWGIPNAGEDIDLNSIEKETKTFSWQEKVFSRSETEFYSNENNCVSDLDKHYHEIISKTPNSPGRLFTYVHIDNFDFDEMNVTTETSPRMSELCREMSNLRLQNATKVNRGSINSGYEINKFLNNSITNPFIANSYETMYVMADLGTSDNDSDIWLKSEQVLCILKYDSFEKILWIYPDFSKNESEPYSLEIYTYGKVYFEYTIENQSNLKDVKTIEEENDILRKLNRRNQELRTEMYESQFLRPAFNKYRVHLFFEILSARNFEYDNLYVQYNIDLPTNNNWICSDETTLFGCTQTCKTKGAENLAHFGYYFDVCLEYILLENNELAGWPQIYFQVISHDSWNRYRIEGITYKYIPVFQPGMHKFDLECIRICPKSPVGELRRYFIGDYSNLDDITWFGVPKDYQENVLNKYGVLTVGTGTIEVRLNILNQSHSGKQLTNASGDGEYNIIREHVNASSLVKSVSDVITAFRRARQKMLKARKNIVENE